MIPRKSFLCLFAILALLVAMVPMTATAQPAAPAAAGAETVGSEQPLTAADLKALQDGPAALAAPPANPAAILYDNGPLTTHPGGGGDGANASAVQTALGLGAFGFSHSISSGFRVADDFTVPAGGWTISTITFYAYQTGSTTTTTINNANLRIWNGPPGQAGSSVVFGDTTTNRLAGSSWSSIYRVLDTGLSDTNRPVMADVVTVNTTLPAGAYWLDWQTGGTLSSGPWAPPVTILGQTGKPGANALQYTSTSGTWAAVVDSGTAQAPQDFPFVIEGQATGGPSISLTKTVGTQAGVCANTSAITVAPGTTVYYCYTVTNTGTVAFDLHTLTDNVLGTIFNLFPYTLAPGATVNTVQAGVPIPYVANATTTNVGTWLAYNPTGGQATAVATATVTVQQPSSQVCNTAPITIPGSGPGTPYPSTISVVGLGPSVTDVNVTLNDVNHEWPDDIDILLAGPQGQNLIIMSDAGGAPDIVNVDLTFDDAAAVPLPDGTQITSGTYQPTNIDSGDPFPTPAPVPSGATQLATFNGTDPNGPWSLYVVDDLVADLGSIAGGWCLDITTTGGQQPPNIDVNPLSLSSTQAPNTTTQHQLDVANTGEATLLWTINEEPGSLRPPIRASRGSQPAAATRRVTLGDAGFSGSSLTPGQVVTPQGPPTAPNLMTITHSASQSIIAGNSVSCNLGGLHTGNSYLREFDLPAFGIGSAFGVTQVQIGVEQALGAGGSQPVTVNLYTKIDPAAPLTFGNLSPIGTATATVSDQSLTLLTVPVVGTAPAGSVLVVEIFTPDGVTAGNTFLIGSNNLGQTAPSYLAAAGCGVPEPTPTGDLGFPGMHIVMNVTGDAATPEPCTTLAGVPWLGEVPAGGTTAGGGSTPVQVTFDSTGLDVGTYTARLCITSNDPTPGPGNETELVQVPVTLTVQGTPAITLVETVGTVPGVCAATHTITVPMGTMVYYCWTVTNTGDMTLSSHTLVDNRMGTIFTNFAHALTPGSTANTVQAGLSIPAVINANTTDISTWTAAQSSTGGMSTTATSSATVNVITLVCNNEGEGFESGVPPLGWTVVSNLPNGPQWTTIGGCGELGNYAAGNGGAACASGLNYPDGTFDTELRSPPFSLAGSTGSDLNFQLNFQSWADIDRLSVDISNNGGTTWNTIHTYASNQGGPQSLPGVNVTLDLTPWAGQPNLMLRWRYYSTASSPGRYAQVDEVKINCFAPPPTAVSLASLSADAAATRSLLLLPVVAALLALAAAFAMRRTADGRRQTADGRRQTVDG